MNIHEFWQAVLTQDRAALTTYFTDDAIIRWRCTNEQFTVSEYIRANCAYPGKWDGEVERVENTESGVVLAGRVFPTDRSCSCHVVSFLRMRDDKISEMDEYWSDDGDAPQWRKEIEMKIGKAIPCCLGAERDNPTRAPARAESAAPLRRHRSEHHMQLDPEPFDRIKSGQKTIELRLLDEKRRKIKEGDEIVFTNTASGKTLRVAVAKLHRFDSFAALYDALPLLQCGYTAETIADASPADMERYYSAEKQKKYGVIGIEVSPPKETTDEAAVLTAK